MLKRKFLKFAIIFLLMTLSLITVPLFFDAYDSQPYIPNFDIVAPFVNSNKYSQLDNENIAENKQELQLQNTIIETAMGTIYLDTEALSFQFVNQNGYIWSTTINYQNSELSPNWQRRVRSAVIIESYNINSSTFALTEEFVLSEGTTTKTKVIPNGFESIIKFGKSKISIMLRVTFSNQGILVEIPNEEIEESGNYKLSSIKVYPFFGAVLEDEIPGYVFLPDGIGALVRYDKAKSNIIANYQKEIYGRNFGYNIESNLNNLISDGSRIYVPVFGFVHGENQNAIFANILSGYEYGLINLYYSGKTTKYTTIFSEFLYRRTYKQPIDRAGNTISLLQTEANELDIKILYTSLEDNEANYLGMAKNYQKFLEDLEILEKQSLKSENIPLKIETIGLEKTKSVLFDKTIVMTTFSEYISILNDLHDNGINNIITVYSGFTNKGYSWSPPNYPKISTKLGNKSDITKINSLSDLYLNCDFVKASNHSKGYSQYSDLAKKINDQLYIYQNSTDKKFLLKPHKTSSLFNDSSKKLQKYNVKGLALSSIGSLLYSDFEDKIFLEDSIGIYQSLVNNSPMKIALYDANNYLWGNIESFMDFPMYSSQYLHFTDTVPFLSLILSNRVNLFSYNANFFAYAKDELLRMIDFGVYPSFIVTDESSKKLQDSNLSFIYSSKYEDLRSSIIKYYQFANSALKHVIGKEVISRNVIVNGLVLINYEEGFQILINYTDSKQIYLGKEVNPKNFLVLKNSEIIEGNL